MECCASGAKDIGSFNVVFDTGQIPSEESITHEGLFHQYYFQTGVEKEKLFACDWGYAVSKDPISGQPEYYICCGMNGKLDGDGIRVFGRPDVNLVVTLDISGSMRESFRDSSTKQSKLEVAKECLLALLSQLRPTDSFGLILFDTTAELTQKLTQMSKINMPELKAKIQKLAPRGGTNMEIGYKASLALYDALSKEDLGSKENRIMFLTDAQPNSYATTAGGLFELCSKAAARRVYTTFLGVGIDFGVQLVDKIAKIKAANYFTVMSAKEFKKLMDEDFDYIVTPCCFDVKVSLQDKNVEVERVYGSPGHELASDGLLVQMDSLFPSAKEGEDTTKGGVVLMKLKRPAEANTTVRLQIDYEDRDGDHIVDNNEVQLTLDSEEKYSNAAIRKAILLTRFVNLMRWWIRDSIQAEGVQQTEATRYAVNSTDGIPCPPVDPLSGKHYVTMNVPKHYKEVFSKFADHFTMEADAIGDEKLQEELKRLTEIANFLTGDELQAKVSELITEEDVLHDISVEEMQSKIEGALGISINSYSRMLSADQERRRKEVIRAKVAQVLDEEYPKLLQKDPKVTDAVKEKLYTRLGLERADKTRWDYLVEYGVDWNLVVRLFKELKSLEKDAPFTGVKAAELTRRLATKGVTIAASDPHTAAALQRALSEMWSYSTLEELANSVVYGRTPMLMYGFEMG